MSAEPVRAAILGAGMIGAVHLRAARDAGAEVIGVLASSAARSAAVASEWAVPRGYASIEDVLEDRPDVVHICTPNDSHLALALAVIEAGIGVIVEKPIALSTADARRLQAAADVAGVLATVPFVYRYHPLVRELRSRRLAGEFGDVTVLHGSYLQDWLAGARSSSWRVDSAVGGPSRAFADIGSHWCDLVEFVSGEHFEAVSASTAVTYASRPHPTGPSFAPGDALADENLMIVDTEDVAVCTFRTARGILANTVISQVSPGRKNRLWFELDGTLGSAVFDQENPESVWLGGVESSRTLHRGAGEQFPEQSRLNRVPAGHPQGYPDAFAAFVADSYAALRGEIREGLPTLRDGARAAALTAAVLRSAAAGIWTAIR